MSIRRTVAATTTVLTLGLATAGAVALAPAASAKGLEVRATGTCSAGVTAKLKAKQDDARIQVEFEVDANRNGQRWNVVLSDNLVVVHRGTATTVAPSGSFTVRKLIANRAGSDVIRATATNPTTGAVCRAALTYPG
ncbi:hypothetical protein GCM10023258_12190 [Terrabacter aeriphilus]|uniref:Uncharacterized protein n=1 Tax=Terrabacter aeriphilus TaxID=515662 RepID=A0ABP9J730_9MICO